jgi:hypothetical protein
VCNSAKCGKKSFAPLILSTLSVLKIVWHDRFRR